MKSKFELLYESIVDDVKTENKREYKSFNEFKHFLNKFDLIGQLDKDEKKDHKLLGCTLYFVNQYDTEHNLIRFDYYNKVNQNYYLQYKNIFDKLEDYRKQYKVTLTR